VVAGRSTFVRPILGRARPTSLVGGHANDHAGWASERLRELHEFHEEDTYNPIDPARLLVFLQAARLVSAGEGLFFTARKSPEVLSPARAPSP
jgi:hypothetical protein